MNKDQRIHFLFVAINEKKLTLIKKFPIFNNNFLKNHTKIIKFITESFP